jgi:arabinogalactan oligomer/maltooligosaccharide transport system permease protein
MTQKERFANQISKNRFARLSESLLYPFASFKKAFKESKSYSRIAMIINLFVPGLGTSLLGDIELGLAYLLGEFLLVLYLATLGWQHLIGRISYSYLNLPLLATLAIAAFLCIYYFALRHNVKMVINKREGRANTGSYVINFFKRTAVKIKTFFAAYAFAYHQASDRDKGLLSISWFILGLPAIIHKQFIRGILLLSFQVLFILYMIARGARDFVGLFTLRVPGILSTQSIVFGVAVIILILFGFFLVFLNVNITLRNVVLINGKEELEKTKEELSSLINKRFYLSALFIPVIGALLFTIIPLVFMILIAFTNYSYRVVEGYQNVVPTWDTYLSWVGFDTFRRVFSVSKNLQDLVQTFSWTMIWAILSTLTCYFGGLFLAMLLNKKNIKGKIIYRSLFVISMALPQFVSLLVMRTMFEDFGPINTILQQWGWTETFISFWDDATISKILIVTINMWVGIPYYMLLMSGLLINVPKDYYEAATIEGASRGQIFSKITFPHLLYMTTPLLITSFVSNINNFNVIWFLTSGEPSSTYGGTAGGTDILITWLYKLTMKAPMDYNFGAAIGIIMFIISATLSLIIFRRSRAYRSEEEYR